MLRTVLVLITLFLSNLSFSNGWEEQTFQAEIGAEHQTHSADESGASSSVFIQSHLTKLIQGVGIKVGGNISQLQPDSETFAAHTNYNLSLGSRIFLSPNVNWDLSAVTSEQLTGEDPMAAVYRDVQSPFNLTNTQAYTSRFNFGSDQAKRALMLTYEHMNDELALTEKFINYGQDTRQNLNTRFQNRITEDTFLVAEYKFSQFEKSFASSSESTLNLNQLLVGFKTSYLSNSRIEFLVGNSNSKDSSKDKSDDTFSWKMTNNLNLSDYLIWNVSISEDTQDSNDESFISAKTVEIATDLRYLLTDNVNMTVELSAKTRQYGDTIKSKQELAQFSIAYRVLEQLNLQTAIHWYSNDDSRDRYDLDGYQWSIGVLWRLL